MLQRNWEPAGTILGHRICLLRKSLRQLIKLLAQKVTGIVVHGQFQETGAAIDNAIAAGIPVICVNTDIESDRLSFLGCNPYNAGVQMAQTMGELIGGKGKIIISNWLSGGQPSALQNMEGCRDELEANWPDIEIVAEVDDKSDETTLQQQQ